MTRTYDSRNKQNAIILAKDAVSVSKLYRRRKKTAHRPRRHLGAGQIRLLSVTDTTD